MRAIRGLPWVLAWTAALWCGPRQSSAQEQPVAAILADGRRQLDELKPDSAALILVRVLDPSGGASRAERVRALVLLGIAELTLSRPDKARQLFQQALALDLQLRLDTLAALHSFLLSTFEEARLSAASAASPGALGGLGGAMDIRPERISCAPARYPDELRRARIQGQVLLRFVIDTLGRAEPSSLRVLRTDHPGFVEPAREVVLGCSFRPGELHGSRVRVQITMPITFAVVVVPRRAPRR